MSFDKVSDFVKESEYLLYSDVTEKAETSECYVHILKEPISQFFRKIIAKKLGCPEKYNYRDNNNLDISNATFETLKKEIANGK